ncbi:hypothetical protein [Thermoclostridium stercorarium]|uniref:hypothetical protein n=1 Tax=Thermoclostridium stercorarium TaxID=1510 RepID=UPI000AE0F707
MAEKKKNDKERYQKIGQVLKNNTFQRILIGAVSLVLVFIMISEGAAPRKYKLTLGMASGFDIRAPRDIENTMKTEELALERVKEIPPVIKELELANTQMLGNIYEFFDSLDNLRSKIIPVMESGNEHGLSELLERENVSVENPILAKLPEELQEYLFRRDSQADIRQLKDFLVKQIMPDITTTVITEENLSEVLQNFTAEIEEKVASFEMQQVAKYILSGVLVPNSMVDEAATEKQKNDFIEAYKLENPVMIYKNERFIRKEDIVTADKLDVARRLGLLDEENRPDYLFLVAVFCILLMLWIILALFLRHFARKTFESRNELMFIASVIVLTVFLAFMSKEFIPEYQSYITLGFIAPVLTVVFLNIQIAVMVNLITTLAVSLMFRDNFTFLIMFAISGTIAAFLSANANQRRKISLTGLVTGTVNILVVACIGMMEKRNGSPSFMRAEFPS